MATSINNTYIKSQPPDGPESYKEYTEQQFRGIEAAFRSFNSFVATAGAPGTATPLMDGTAAVGTSGAYAREDHVHPTDTSRQAALGYTPLRPSLNLSDVANAATALTNLGAQAALGYTPLRPSLNLSDLASASTARSNLGLGSLATLNALPNPSATTLGGVQSKAAVTSQWINSISTSGVPASSQPAAGDITGLAASATTDTTNAANISSGTLNAARLPTPAATTLGGVKSLAAVSHKFLTSIGTDGLPVAAQPVAADISGLGSLATLNSVNDSNWSGTALSAANGGTGDTGTAWTTYTPTVASGSGAITTSSATGRYKRIGKTLFIEISVTITTNGTGATYVTATLPAGITSGTGYYPFYGRESAVFGKQLQGATGNSTTTVLIWNYDNSYPGANGTILNVSGTVETA